MKKSERQQHILENLIYLIIWITVMATPIFEQVYNNENTINWNDILRGWKMIAPFFILFLINNYILLPFLLIRKKSWLYLLFTAGTIVLLGVAMYQINKPDIQEFNNLPFPGKRIEIPPRESQNNPPREMEPHNPHFRKPMERNFKERVPLPLFWRLGIRPPFIHFILFSMLVLGVNIAIKLLFKSLQDDRKMKELEKEKLKTELDYLKHQINPHFFMNTLNNIHALIDIDTEKAKETVLELSKMMRYLLYDSAQPSLPLDKEFTFLRNYIELMKIRYTNQVDIMVSIPEIVPDIKIPPLLFISFIENAFKHGITYQQKSFIQVSMDIRDAELHCQVINSNFDNINGQHKGIGLDNIRQRLRLLYGDNYKLEINNENNEFHVLLIIPI